MSASRRVEAASRATMRGGAALILSVLAFTPANAGSVSNYSCVGRWTAFNCAEQSGDWGNPYIRLVPEPLGETERGLLAARDHRWLDHCHPVVQYDRYGVARYRYSAAGCEYGVGAD